MSERRNSQIIHEARGLCWHKFEPMCGEVVIEEKTLTIHNPRCQGECVSCGAETIVDYYWSKEPDSTIEEICSANSQEFVNPDYTDPTAYLEAMAWAKEQEWWGRFVVSLQFEISHTHEIVLYNILDPKLGSHALAEFLEGREG